MLKRKQIYLTPIIGFLSVIIIGAVVLKLPICNNKSIDMIDAFFTSTSAIAVNGLTTVVISEQFNILGQTVILILNEIGALGFMSFVVLITLWHKKMRFSEIIIAGNSIEEEIYANVKKRIKNIFKYSIIIQFIGVFLLSIKLVPMFGLEKGLWYSIFHSITAFCNAGFDIFGDSSLTMFKDDIYLNIVIITLIIIGGIGFLVIEDLVDCRKKSLNKLNLQTKIVLLTTISLLIISTLIIKILEPNMTALQSLFLATTLRTAGFYTVNVNKCSDATKIICGLLMFIGGAPGSTSGGIRVVVFAVLILATISTLRNQKETVVFYRKINQNAIKKAITITVLSITIILIGIISMLQFDNLGTGNIIFQCISAFSATGLEIFSSSLLNNNGKIIIMILMFIGRIGPISMFSLFINDTKQTSEIEYVEGKIVLL